jgi:hypothetical protein
MPPRDDIARELMAQRYLPRRTLPPGEAMRPPSNWDDMWEGALFANPRAFAAAVKAMPMSQNVEDRRLMPGLLEPKDEWLKQMRETSKQRADEEWAASLTNLGAAPPPQYHRLAAQAGWYDVANPQRRIERAFRALEPEE